MNELEKAIMTTISEGTQYSGSKSPGELKISASSLNDDPLRLYLKYKHGSIDKDEFTASTIGTIFQLGADSIFGNKDGYEIATRRSIELDNGFTVSGEIDLGHLPTKSIIDFKVLSGPGYNSALKNDMNSTYNLQQAVYLLLFPEYENAHLFLVNKAGSLTKGNIKNLLKLQVHTKETIMEKLINKTNLLKEFIDADQMPNQCSDIWDFGKTKGQANRCQSYCDYNKVCPHYQQYTNSYGYTDKMAHALI